jgi:hypothetical protein
MPRSRAVAYSDLKRVLTGRQCWRHGFKKKRLAQGMAMGWKIVSGSILAIVFGPAILAFLVPATTRLSIFSFVFGGLQIALGVTLYLMAYAGGVNWPWPLLVAALGMYYVYRGTEIRRLSAQRSDAGPPKLDPGQSPASVRVAPSSDASN